MTSYPLLNDQEWLHNRYITEQLSTTEIARLAGVKNDNHATVRRALVRHGIPLRSVAEGRRAQVARLPEPNRVEKACTKCSIVKPLTSFHHLPSARDGRNSWCKECVKPLVSDGVQRMRLAVVAALGGKCQWEDCGITDVRLLTIDHREGGGNQHRKATRSNPYGYYKQMLDHLPDYQVLCWNHNHLKRILLREHRKPPVRPTTVVAVPVV